MKKIREFPEIEPWMDVSLEKYKSALVAANRRKGQWLYLILSVSAMFLSIATFVASFFVN